MIKKIIKKSLLYSLFILSISIITFIYLWRYINSYLSRSRASGISVTLSFSSSEGEDLTVGNKKDFYLQMSFNEGSESERINYLRIPVKFPQDLLEVKNVDTASSGLGRVISISYLPDGEEYKMLSIELGALDPNSRPSTKGLVIVAKITFEGKKAGTGEITIYSNPEPEIVNNKEIPEKFNKDQITIKKLNFTVKDSDSTPTQTPTPTPSPLPKWGITLQAVCQTSSMVLKPETKLRMFRILWPWVNPTTRQYSPFDFNCLNDVKDGNSAPTHYMEIQSENPLNDVQNIYVGLELPVRNNAPAVCAGGIAFEPYEITPFVPNICASVPASGDYICFGKYFNPYNYMAKWDFKRLTPRNYTIKVRIPDEHCVNPTPTPTSTPTPTPTPTKTPTPTPTNTPTPTPPSTSVNNITLNLNLRFQGIVNQCPSGNKKIKVKVKLGGIKNTDYQQADFTCENGKWKGSVSFDASSGSGYLVFVKGEKHLQKKICDQIPQESALGPGTYNCRDGKITLNTGANNLDFTGIVNLYGDLPVGGNQDGVINSLDSSYIRNNLGKSDSGVLTICDGNLDGKCDTQDWSMLIMALSIKGDEL